VTSWARTIFARAVINDPVLAALMARYTTGGMNPSPDEAARKVAVGSSIRLITNTVSGMPVDAMRTIAGVARPVTGPVSPLLTDPEASGRGFRDWCAQLVWALGARGNCFGHIVARDPRSGYPTTIVPVHPDEITPRVDKRTGILTWKIRNGAELAASEVMHVRLFPVPGQVLGLSPIAEHARTVGLSIAAEKFGAQFFDAGGHPTALLRSKDALTDVQAREVKRRFLNATTAREPVLLPDGVEYQAIQVNPEESQFLNTWRYTAADCARIFGPGMAEILGYDTAGAMTYQNVADRDLHLLKYTIAIYLTALEGQLSAYLPNGQYAKFNRNSLLQMNPLARAQQYQIMNRIGAIVPNEVRALEDMPPVDWGDVPYPDTKHTETEQIGPDGQAVAPAGSGGAP